MRASLWIGTRTTIFIRRLLKMRVIALARYTFLPSESDQRYLMFETNWSGAEQSYIPDLAELMQIQWRSIWGAAKGFPGPVPTTELLEYIREHDWGTDHFWSDYHPDATTQVIKGSLELQSLLEGFVGSTRGLPPDLFAERWREFSTAVEDLL